MEVNSRPHKSSYSVGARGRIAQVLAQARASLNEPSRPITPAGLDARASLDNLNLNYTKSSPPVMPSYDSFNKKSYYNKSSSIESQNFTTFSSIRSDENVNFKSNDESKIDDHESHKLSDQYQLILMDLNDAIQELETNPINSSFLVRKEPLNPNNIAFTNLKGILESLEHTVMNITKIYQKDDKLSKTEKKNAEIMRQELSQVLLRTLHLPHLVPYYNTIRKFIFRLQLYLLRRKRNLNYEILSTLSIAITSLRYDIIQLEKSLSTNELSVPGGGMSQGNQSKSLSKSMSMTSEDMMHKSSDENEIIGQMDDMNIDLILEIMNTFWSRFHIDFSALHELLKSNSDHNDRHSSHHLGAIKQFLKFLDIGADCSVILRRCVAYDIIKKKLMHSGLLQSINDGLIFIVSFIENKLKNYHSSHDSGHMSVPILILVEYRLLFIANQFLLLLRNLSLDSGARQQIHTLNIIGALTALMTRALKNSPEFVLNCTRITAKLSLMENFRSQLNKNPEYILAFVDIIINEGKKCTQVMNGEMEYNHGGCDYDIDQLSHMDSIQDKEIFETVSDVKLQIQTIRDDEFNWPAWNTWPMLSRAAFTLGNLTTSNEANRKIVGCQKSLLKSVIVLLQACSGALSQLASSENDTDKNQDDEDDEGEDVGKSELIDATIKLLRLLANLSIDKNIGYCLVSKVEPLQVLSELLVCASQTSFMSANLLINNNEQQQQEELLLNAVAACTNLTFYACHNNPALNGSSFLEQIDLDFAVFDGEQSVSSSMDCSIQKKTKSRIERYLTSLSLHLSHCLFHDNTEIVLESARALGNLTRHKKVLQALLESRTLDALLLLISKSDKDVVAAIIGALINFSGDHSGRLAMVFGLYEEEVRRVSTQSKSKITEYKGEGREGESSLVGLVSVLRRASLKDISLSILVCQVFHNLLIPVVKADNNSDNKSLQDREQKENEDGHHDERIRYIRHLQSCEWIEKLSMTLLELVDCAQEFLADVQSTPDAQIDSKESDTNDGGQSSANDKAPMTSRYESYSTLIRVGNLLLDLIHQNIPDS